VQTFAVNKVNNSLSEKLGNKIHVESVDINFFNNVDLHKIYVEDQAQDTLAYVEELNVSASLIGLLKKELHIKQIALDGAVIHLKKDANTELFNYQFIIDAFASTDTTTQTVNGTPFNIDIDNIEFTKTHFILEDNVAGSDINFLLDIGEIEISTFDLDNLIFELDELSMDKAVLDFVYTPDPSAPAAELAFPLIPIALKLKDISLNNAKVAIRAKNSSLQKGTLVYDNLAFTEFQLVGHNINVDSSKITGELNKLQAKDHSGFELKNLKSTFYVDNQKIELQEFEMATPFSKISNQTLLTFADFSELQKIEKLKLNTNFNNTSISLIDIQYLTNLESQKLFKNTASSEKVILNGTLKGDASNLNFTNIVASVPAIIDAKLNGSVQHIFDMDRLAFDLNIEKLKTSSVKLGKILEANTIPEELDAFGDISLVGKFKGDLKSFQISNMNLGTSAKTSAQLSGTVKNAMDLDKLLLDVNIQEVKTHLDDIKGFIEGDLPLSLKDAGAIGYTGVFKGTLSDFDLDGKLTTDIGNAKTDVALNFSSDYKDASYDGEISLEDFNLGSVLNNEDFGNVSLNINSKGSGLDFDNIDNQLNAKFSSLVYKNIDYQNFEFNGSISKKVINGDFNIDNPNAKAKFTGILDLSKDQPDMNFQLNVDTLQLKPMNITSEDITFSGKTKVVGEGKSLDDFIGFIQIDNLNVSMDSISYHTDSLVCSSIIDGESQKKIKFHTDGIDADILGDFTLSQLPIYINNVVDQYIPVAWISEQTDEEGKTLDDPQIFRAELQIEDEKLLHLFLPDLEEMKNFQLKARVNSETDSLIMNGTIETITYDGITTTDIRTSTANEDNKIKNKINFKDLTGIGNLMLPNTTIDANLEKDSLLVFLDVKSDSSANMLNLGAALSKENDLYEVNFRDQLQLDSASWNIAADNSIKFKDNYLDIQSLEISKREQRLAIESEAQNSNGNAPLDIKIENFDVNELSNLFALENDVIYGKANGDIVLDNIFKNINYSGDLLIKDIIIEKDEIGDFKLIAAKRATGQIIDLDVSLLGSENDFAGKGYVDLEANQIEFNSDFDNLKLAVLDPFLVGIISESKGSFGGKVTVKGSLDKPVIDGNIKTNKLSTLIDFSKARYEINNQNIRINNSKISFEDVALLDSKGNTAMVNGKIDHRSFSDFYYDLKINAEGFQLLNTTADDNPLFYGTIFLDARAKITGPLELPNLDVDAKSLTGSRFFLSPFIETDVISKDEYIIFTSKEFSELDSTELISYELKNTLPLKLDLNLDLDEQTEFQFIIDPVSGDHLSCFGNSTLRIAIAPSGSIEVYGNYTVNSGTYSFSYENYIKRKFQLSPGGQVTFQGDPLLARFDVDAVYNTKATPAALLVDEDEKAAASKRTAVQIQLNLSGSVSDLNLGFGINFPNDDFGSTTAVGRRITEIENNQEELYNQVFALLLLNSFLNTGESNINLGNAGTNLALKSVSGLIENRLNNIADKLLKGVEVSVNLDSYSSEYVDKGNTSVTEVGLGLSKKLLNDRLTLKAIGNVDVDNSNSSGGASGLAGDFIIEYQLNKQGNYTLTAFRKSDYNILQDENANKNGASIAYKKSFRLRRVKNKADEK